MASLQPLIDSQELRAVIDSINDYAIFLLDPSGQVMTWNRGAQRIKGYAADEIIGQSFKRFYTPEDLEDGRADRLLAAAFRDGRVEDEGYRVRKDGTRFWADVVISAVRDEDGDLRGYVKVTRDLTDRRTAEEELRVSEERLRLMISSVKDYAIFMLTPTGYVATWNPGAEQLKGYTAQEIIGQHFSRFYLPEEVAAGKPARELEIAAETGKFEEEGIRVRKDGTRFWASVVLSAVRNPDDSLFGFAKVTRDLTSRKRATEEMEQRNRQQAAVAELGLFAVQTTQLSSLLERAVQTARDTLGIDEIGMVGAEEAAFAGGIRVPIHAADQSATPYGFLSVGGERPLSPGDTSFLQAVANVVSAVIARSQMEQQLRAAERAAVEERGRTQQAQEALRLRDEFISVAAHELRTPLTALHLKLQGLERSARGTGTKEAQRLDAAVRQAERLARLIDRLLDVSRISQGKLEMSREQFDMVDLVHQVIDDFREPAAQAQAPLQLDAPTSLHGSWDRLRLEQVLVNILSNAVKYGAGKPIRVKLGGDERRVRIEITDAGIGIPEADLDRIFGRFERASSIRHYGGLGLGLYITRHIVEGHGGTISAASTVGQGSTFTVDLPRFGGASGRPPQVRA